MFVNNVCVLVLKVCVLVLMIHVQFERDGSFFFSVGFQGAKKVSFTACPLGIY